MPKPLPRARRYSFRQRTSSIDYNRPMSDLNITPLIDVLLVLLVMLMLSIPIATHKAKLTLPPGSDRRTAGNQQSETHCFWPDDMEWFVHQKAALKEELIAMSRDPNNPQLHLQTDSAARYEEFDHLVATIKRSGVRKWFCWKSSVRKVG